MEKLPFFINKKLIYLDLERTRNRNMYLKIKNEKILISAPIFVSQTEIEKFVSKHIDKFLKYIEDIKKNKLYSLEDKYIFLGGRKFTIQLLTGFNNPEGKISGKNFYIMTKSGSDEENEKVIKHYLKYNLLKYIKERQKHFEKLMNIVEHEVVISYKTSTWGTNFINDKKISYSARLLHYNKNVIDYVVVHELAHYIEPNHSQSFWEVVRKYCPDFETLKQELRADHELNEE